MASDLLHDALLRATTKSHIPPSAPSAQLASLHLSSSSSPTIAAEVDSDDELVEVRTPAPQSTATTPAASRSTSPSRSPATGLGGRSRSGAGKPRRDKTKELAKAKAAMETMDPLTKLPAEANVRIFGALDMDELLVCGLVCKKWRKSQTINWTWFCLLESLTYVTPSARTTSSSSVPTWRKGDSKVDWAARFASINRRDDLEKPDSEVDEDGQTFQEAREAKWKEMNEANEAIAGDKNAMRAYYKNLKNSKVKGKYGKGAERTWEGDGLGGGGDDYI